MDKNTIKVIGLGQNFEDIFPSYNEIIKNADVLVGGKRQLNAFYHISSEKIHIIPPISKVIEKIKKRIGKNIVVLCDGDPLTYGFGKRLILEFGKELVEIYPNISVLQRAGAKLGLSVLDIYPVSLHGRDEFYKLLNAISWHNTVGVYTDKKYNPKFIAQELKYNGVEDFQLVVFENLGEKDEKISTYSLDDIINNDVTFSPLNFVIIKRCSKKEIEPYIGMDDEFFFKDRNQITKKEVRVLSLSKLELKEDSFFVDIGAGSGSMSIEASIIAKKGKIIAVEKDNFRCSLINKNKKRFGIYSIKIINDNVLNVISSIEELDRVFIGGGLNDNPYILKLCYKKLKPGGIIVTNVVLLETLVTCIDFCKQNSIPLDISQVMVNRVKTIGYNFRLSPINPVFILCIKKECGV